MPIPVPVLEVSAAVYRQPSVAKSHNYFNLGDLEVRQTEAVSPAIGGLRWITAVSTGAAHDG